MTTNLKTLPPLELKRASAATGVVEGWAARFDELDAYDERVRRGAFTRSLQGIAASGHRVPMLWAHDQGEPIGSWTTLEERAEGLWAVGRINTATARGREALELVKDGDLSGLSIGYTFPEGGRKRLEDGTFELLMVELKEVSLVALPAASKARIVLRDFPDIEHFSEWLRSTGVSRREAEFVARKAWPALTGEDDTENSTQLVAALQASAQRFTKGT